MASKLDSADKGASKKSGFFSRIGKMLGLVKEKAAVLVIGLDNSGKTTILNRLKPSKGGEVQEVTPTIGFTLERFSQDRLSFTCFDMSGQSKYRSLWEKYYRNVQGIIWVIDSTDQFRMCVVKDELKAMLAHEDIKSGKAPILFFANKMDKPTALTPPDCLEHLELDNITSREWHISASNALTGEGVPDGIQWLVGVLKKSGTTK